MDRKTVETCSLVRRVHISACFWEKRTLDSAKDEKDHPDYYQRKIKKPASVMVWGCIDAHGMGDVKVPLMQRLILEFWRDICCHQDDYFSQELHIYFSRTMLGLILHELQWRGFVGIESVCLTGLPAVQICLLLKMYGAS